MTVSRSLNVSNVLHSLIAAGNNVKKVNVPIVSIALSQLYDCRVGAHLRLHGPEPAVSCRHSSVMWVVGHTSPTHWRYLPSV